MRCGFVGVLTFPSVIVDHKPAPLSCDANYGVSVGGAVVMRTGSAIASSPSLAWQLTLLYSDNVRTLLAKLHFLMVNAIRLVNK